MPGVDRKLENEFSIARGMYSIINRSLQPQQKGLTVHNHLLGSCYYYTFCIIFEALSLYYGCENINGHFALNLYIYYLLMVTIT